MRFTNQNRIDRPDEALAAERSLKTLGDFDAEYIGEDGQRQDDREQEYRDHFCQHGFRSGYSVYLSFDCTRSARRRHHPKRVSLKFLV